MKNLSNKSDKLALHCQHIELNMLCFVEVHASKSVYYYFI